MVGDRRATSSTFPPIARTFAFLRIAIQPTGNLPTPTNLSTNGPLHRALWKIQVYEGATSVLRGGRDPARRQVAHPCGRIGDPESAWWRVRLLHQPLRVGARIPN